MNVYPRESIEFQTVEVTLDGVPVTDVQLTVTAAGGRPFAWEAPAIADEKIGVLIAGRSPGFWTVWAKVTSLPETVVIDCGTFEVS